MTYLTESVYLHPEDLLLVFHRNFDYVIDFFYITTEKRYFSSFESY